MSVHISSDVWRYSEAKGAALLVLLSLADQANDDGQCWPKIEQIATRCRVSRASVFRYLQELRELGEVTWEDRQAKGLANLYTVTLTPSQIETGPRLNVETGPVSAVRPHRTVTRTVRKDSSDDEQEAAFQQFYGPYPRHDAVGAARKAWASVVVKGKVDPALVVAGAVRYAALCERSGTERQFIALPASWLRAERWLDEIPEERAPRTEGFGW